MGYNYYRNFHSCQKNTPEVLEKLVDWLEINNPDYMNAVYDPDWHRWEDCHADLMKFTQEQPNMEIWLDETGECEDLTLLCFKAGVCHHINRIIDLSTSIEMMIEKLACE